MVPLAAELGQKAVHSTGLAGNVLQAPQQRTEAAGSSWGVLCHAGLPGGNTESRPRRDL